MCTLLGRTLVGAEQLRGDARVGVRPNTRDGRQHEGGSIGRGHWRWRVSDAQHWEG